MWQSLSGAERGAERSGIRSKNFGAGAERAPVGWAGARSGANSKNSGARAILHTAPGSVFFKIKKYNFVNNNNPKIKFFYC